jgi:hypothetical protein
MLSQKKMERSLQAAAKPLPAKSAEMNKQYTSYPAP